MKSALIAAVIRLVTGVGVRWAGCLPDPRLRVYFANHTSHLDTLVLWSSLPASIRDHTRPVAARDYWDTGPVRRFLARAVFNAVLIDRQRAVKESNPLEPLLEAIDHGFSLIFFPEGGRQTGPDPAPFKSGLFHLAKARPNVEFIPVYIDNMNRILPKGEVLPVPLLGCISFGAPLKVEADEGKESFLERARGAMLDLKTRF